ncbi:uroporphyrin-III C-methyltransferase [Pseudomonas aeruginosa]|nr:uroporphyrin-III C-methyltransferase [Pseudomonas aeruginosa]
METDIQARFEALRALCEVFDHASFSLAGRERPALLVSAAHHEAPGADLLERIDRQLELLDGPILAYDDPRRAIGKRVRLEDGRIVAVRLAGETLVRDWLKELWLTGRADSELRRWLLAPLGAAPGTTQPGCGRQDPVQLPERQPANGARRHRPRIGPGRIEARVRLRHRLRLLRTGNQETAGGPPAHGGECLRRTTMSGKVWLVGAGPGDPELLTLKAVRALQDADVVMVDDLVNPSILEHCPSARLVRVGKRGGCRSTPQDFIQRLMLRHARQGRSVVRLKGGDPCIFGRAGEEAEWLARHGIDSEIVNGITAGLAGATACGIPLTYRGISRGVTLVTAHTQDDSPLAWEALARSGTTLVVYMGVARLAEIQAGLLAGGHGRGYAAGDDRERHLGQPARMPQQPRRATAGRRTFRLEKPGDPGDRRSNPRHRVATDFPERLTSGLFPGKEKPGLGRVFP